MTLPYTLAFASGADYVTGSDLATGGLEALTVETVARVAAWGVCNRPLVQKYAAGAGEWALYVTTDGRLYFVVYDADGDTASAWSAAGAVPTGVWRHYAGVLDNATGVLAVYIDGADVTEDYSATGIATKNTATVAKLGGVLGALATGFVGRLAWARVSSIARYLAGFAPNYAAPASDAYTLKLWDMSEGAGATVDGDTLTGATWGVWGGRDASTINALLDHVLGGGDLDRPGTLYLGLGLANPLTAADEVSGSSYARQAVTNDATNFPAASAGAKVCQSAFTFPVAGADWGQVQAFGLWDALTGGNLLHWGPVGRAFTVRTGAQVRLPATALTLGAW